MDRNQSLPSHFAIPSCHPIATQADGGFEHALTLSHGAGHDGKEPHPLPFQQLTRLQLESGSCNARDVLTMVSDLPGLEVLEMIDLMCQAFELRAFDAAALSKLPKLRLVGLSGTPFLWGEPFSDDTSGHQAVQGQLMQLQRACPNITWVVDEFLGR